MNNSIANQSFSGERPLYESRELRIERITIGEGESGLKESRHIEAVDCRFDGMYILWECEDVECHDCTFGLASRASLWYTRRLRMHDCVVHSPKAFREIDRLTIERVTMTDGDEAFWYCRGGEISDLKIEQGFYAFMHSCDLRISHLWLMGKYIFQYARNIEIHNAVLDTKDAFWNSENVTVYDSEIKGEYLGWYSKNLRLVRCQISGTQPLCYCENLILEDCTFAPDADLAFEYSSVHATLLSPVTSIKNPLSGFITCHSCAAVLRDTHAKAPDSCTIRFTAPPLT